MARLAPVPPGSSGPRPAIRNGVPAARRVLLVARRVSLSAHTGRLEATGGDPPCSFHRTSFRLALGSISDCPHPAAHPTFLGLVVAAAVPRDATPVRLLGFPTPWSRSAMYQPSSCLGSANCAADTSIHIGSTTRR